MKTLFCKIAVFSLILFLFGCQNKTEEEIAVELYKPVLKEEPTFFENPQKLVAFVDERENGYIKLKTIEEITYCGILKPTDYLLAQKRIEENNPNLKKSDFENLQYFDLRISINDFHSEFIKFDLESAEEYQRRVDYCAFKMQHDIKLLDGKDTLECLLFHYERAFNVVPYGHFILGFKPNEGEWVNCKTLVFEDHLFNNGTIKFTFSPMLIAKEPTLL